MITQMFDTLQLVVEDKKCNAMQMQQFTMSMQILEMSGNLSQEFMKTLDKRMNEFVVVGKHDEPAHSTAFPRLFHLLQTVEQINDSY